MEIADPSENASTQAISTTIFEQPVLLNQKQLEEYWDLFPKTLKTSLVKAVQNQLPAVTDAQLTEKLVNYRGK